MKNNTESRLNDRRRFALPIISVVVLTSTSFTYAQTVPTELLDLSIEDLFETRVVRSEDNISASKRWNFELGYDSSLFDQYFIGQSKTSYDDVLFQPGAEPRTTLNYPVVPTKIKQEVQSLRLAYELSSTVTLRGHLPLIHQSTDHISIIPGYDEFNISSNGVGDVVLLADSVVFQTVNSVLRVGSGLSIPTGSIDEEGDTPRAPGDQQLPYTMQLGSGTWDIPLLVSYQKYEANTTWGLEANARIRTGTNDRDYSLGNTYALGGWIEFPASESIKLGMRTDYISRGKIDGSDTSLTVPIPGFPYPAPVVDPNAFGGEQVDVTLYVALNLSQDWRMKLRYKQPVWLDLNGPQSALDRHVSISVSTSF